VSEVANVNHIQRSNWCSTNDFFTGKKTRAVPYVLAEKLRTYSEVRIWKRNKKLRKNDAWKVTVDVYPLMVEIPSCTSSVHRSFTLLWSSLCCHEYGYHSATDAQNTRLSINNKHGCWVSANANKTRKSKHSQECKTHAGTVCVPCDLDLWLSDPKINGFPGLMVEHFYIKFGDPSCSSFWDIMQINRQTPVKPSGYPHDRCRRGHQYAAKKVDKNNSRKIFSLYQLTTYYWTSN